MSYHVDQNGYYGRFGGAFIPEMMYPNVDELRNRYLEVIESEEFRKEYTDSAIRGAYLPETRRFEPHRFA